MGKKLDFVKKEENTKEQVKNTTEEKTPLETLKEMGEGDVKLVENLTDDELSVLISNLSITDNTGRTIVFANKDEAIIYATQLQKNIREIRFCKLIEAYSIHIGTFWIVEPMGTELARQTFDKDESKYDTSEDFVLCSSITLAAIIERAKRDNKLKEEKNNQNK